MDQEFNDINDVLLDLFIDQLHDAAELEMEEDLDCRLGQWLSG